MQGSLGEIQTSLYRNLIGPSMTVMLSTLWPIIILPPWLDCTVIITKKKKKNSIHVHVLYYKNDICLKLHDLKTIP
jgi:hypothetical protein